MSDYTHLWLFFALVTGVIALPGLDMAFVLGSSLTGGKLAGWMAIAGIAAGAICHVLLTTLGISALLRLIPGAAHALLIVGALYIAWIGISLLRSHATLEFNTSLRTGSAAKTFRTGAITSLLNPKAYLFMLAVFPRFLRTEYGPVWLQAVVLWLIIAMTQVAIYGALALSADRVRMWSLANPSRGSAASRGVGCLLIATAAATIVQGLQI